MPLYVLPSLVVTRTFSVPVIFLVWGNASQRRRLQSVHAWAMMEDLCGSLALWRVRFLSLALPSS